MYRFIASEISETSLIQSIAEHYDEQIMCLLVKKSPPFNLHLIWIEFDIIGIVFLTERLSTNTSKLSNFSFPANTSSLILLHSTSEIHNISL